MPDWRDESSYEFTRKLSSHDWAWEFLRRSRTYLSLWQEWQADRIRLLDGWQQAMSNLPGGTIQDAYALPEAKPLQDFEARWRELGLKYLVEPDESAALAKSAFFIRVDVPVIGVFGANLTLEMAVGKEWQGYPYHVHLAFTLGLPLDAQLEAAKIELERHREIVVRRGLIKPIAIPEGVVPRTSKFVTYIRLLDGRAAGCSQTELGQALFPHQPDSKRTVQAVLTTAQKMTEHGYKQLLMRPDVPEFLG